MIDPTAIIHKEANLADNVSVGPYAVIEAGVTIANGCKIASHAIIRKGTTLEANVSIDSFAIIGGLPQNNNKGFDEDTPSGVLIKEGSVLREYVTVHRATLADKNTEIGKNCFLMGTAHVAHDCKLGDNVVMTNGAFMGGFTQIGSFVNLGGGAGLHQFLNIGEGSMIGGHASLTLDIPPFLMVTDRNRVHGLNLIGIKRRGFSSEEVTDLKACFSSIFNEPGNPYKKAEAAKNDGLGITALGSKFLSFFENKGPKGCVQGRQLERKSKNS